MSFDPQSDRVKWHEGPSVAAYVWLVIDTYEFLCTALYGDVTATFWSQAALVRPTLDIQVSSFFSVIEEQMVLSMLRSLRQAYLFQVVFLQALHEVT